MTKIVIYTICGEKVEVKTTLASKVEFEQLKKSWRR